MTNHDRPLDDILQALQERAKELSCLYRVDEILAAAPEAPLEQVFGSVVEALPPGWQYPQVCEARLELRGQVFATAAFEDSPWEQAANVVVQGERVGRLSVVYRKPMPAADEGPFLKEERKLIDTVADRLAQFVLHRELTSVFARASADVPDDRPDWRVILDLLRRTDRTLLRRISRRMLNHLSCGGVEEAKSLLLFSPAAGAEPEVEDENRPLRKSRAQDPDAVAAEAFRLASEHLSEQEILSSLQTWLKEDRVNFLLHALESTASTLVELGNVLERYQHTGVHSRDLSLATQAGLKVSLIRRLLTDEPTFIATCRRWADVEDFLDLIRRMVVLPDSHGRLGGKSSGLFLATQVIRRSREFSDVLRGVKFPKTWYVPSDGIVHFVSYNDLDEVYNWKYRPIDQIRQEYPHILQVFKNSRFPPEFVNGLSRVLDDMGDVPLIVRSSSLLEDRFGSAFSGKYKSLFLANQGAKAARLDALLDAVAEVYASVFSPDAVQYRVERGLLEQHEEMGVMIQEVVGRRAGRYFLPAFSGVAFSNNELRWSSRIKREDGLLRMVPGLGTRAVDRLADDYPVLIAPGQPGLRVNVSPEEVLRYSPKKVDVINLETNAFETIAASDLVREVGDGLPGLAQLVSIVEGDLIRRPAAGVSRVDPDQVVFTFDGLTRSTGFITQMKALIRLLRDALDVPVDLEFASDGKDLYLVQCRAQSYAHDAVPVAIPKDLPADQVLFSADRYVSNGRVGDITHVVYVDPDAYAALGSAERMKEVGRAVSRLNEVLPKRQFILMGPGRWGSRGDIRLGVPITYSDINNTAVLVEVARKRGNYVPDLSFGTHFFQDLVESSIRYLPLYPDDEGVVFNEAFFHSSRNLLRDLLPDFADLEEVVRVIDVPAVADGRVLRILMNAEVEQAVGILAPAGPAAETDRGTLGPAAPTGEEHWRWRLLMAQRIALEMDPWRFGVRALYVFGSTKNATAGPGSDIDLILHFAGTPEQEHTLKLWLEGWSLCLAELNFLRTGYRSEGLLDVQYVTDDDVARQTSFASKIGAVTDAARPLALAPRRD